MVAVNTKMRAKALKRLGFLENSFPQKKERNEKIHIFAREAHDNKENADLQTRFEKAREAYYFLKLSKFSQLLLTMKEIKSKLAEIKLTEEEQKKSQKKYTIFVKVRECNLDNEYKESHETQKKVEFDNEEDLKQSLEKYTEMTILNTPHNQLPQEGVEILCTYIQTQSSFMKVIDQSFLLAPKDVNQIKNRLWTNKVKDQKEHTMFLKKKDLLFSWILGFTIIGMGLAIAFGLSPVFVAMVTFFLLAPSITSAIDKIFCYKNYIATCKDPKALETIYTKENDIESLKLGVQSKEWIPYLKSYLNLRAYNYGPYRTGLNHAILDNKEVLDSIASMKPSAKCK